MKNLMPIPFIKNLLKKYQALVLPMGLLVLGAVLFIPTLLIGKAVSAKIEEALQMDRELGSLISQAPPIRQKDQTLEYSKQFEQKAQSIESLAQQTSRREFIKYNLFPLPADRSSQVYLDFGKQYRAAIEALIHRLNALDAPSETEIRSRLGAGGISSASSSSFTSSLTGGPSMSTGTEENPVINALCTARAEKISVYAHPKIFPWYDYWEKYNFVGEDQAIQDCWNAQAAYWIYEDVIATIESINQGSLRVSTSPVKRLLGVSFQSPVSVAASSMPGSMMPGSITMSSSLLAQGASIAADPPAYVTAFRPSPLTGIPWTGRVGNEDLDVVHFAVSVIVDNRYVHSFFKELCSAKSHQYRENFDENGKVITARHNQITILRSSVSAMNKNNPLHTFYRYGTGGVMQADLICEYLFYRKAYDSKKPDLIKKALGQMEAAADPGMTNTGLPMETQGSIPGF